MNKKEVEYKFIYKFQIRCIAVILCNRDDVAIAQRVSLYGSLLYNRESGIARCAYLT